MPLLGSQSFLGLLETFRVLTFEGRYGGGKSALSFYVAQHLLSTGRFRYLLSNTPSVWSDDPNDVVLRPDDKGRPTYLDAVVILDETGLFLEYAEDTKKFLAFLRKGNIVLLCPSVQDVPRELRGVMVQRTLNLETVGIPIWVYNYRVRKGSQRDNQRFMWWNPSEIYGIYDSGAFPIDDAGLGEMMLDWTFLMSNRERKENEQRRYKGRKKERTQVIEGLQPACTERIFTLEEPRREVRAASNLEGVLEEIEERISEFEALSIKRGKGRH